ncbi:energy transducer TonB [Caulobacter sp. NIBR2454]|uniref:energy transducer TonB n=1 Tax=Caulobacter sp. NIBR2454 TaxID=3015996 RepID=UPI0022B7164E|nr:energy transducer TonB [Caulobacter sp. NIBR2454]
MARERSNRTPFLAGSLILHAAVIGSMFVSWPWMTKKMVVASVPVTIVAEGPTNVRPAVQGPEDLAAQTEDPQPDATPEPVAPPAPVPEPAPPTPSPRPSQQPVPKKQTPAPAPQKPQQKPNQAKPKEDSFDLDALAASINKGRKPAGKPNSGAQRGPSRAETAVQARPAAGAATGMTASQLATLGAQLERLWNPNCEVEGGADVNLVVQATISSTGQLVGQPRVTSGLTGNPITQAAATRAVSAFGRAAPFSVPPGFRQQAISFRFNAKSACS